MEDPIPQREWSIFGENVKKYNSVAAMFAAKRNIQSAITSRSGRDHSVTAVFAAYEIGREGGDGSAQCGRSVIYSCLVFDLKCIDRVVCRECRF